MMNRRGFFGSVLGLVGTTAFAIEEAKPVIPFHLQRLQLAINMFTCKESELLNYKLVVHNNHQQKFFAPKLTHVDRDVTNMKIVFHAAPIKITQAVVAVGCEVVTKENMMIVGRRFTTNINLIESDQMNVTYSFFIEKLPRLAHT